jgi:hypothetical protein
MTRYLIALTVGAAALLATSATYAQEGFSSPDKAADALVAAARSGKQEALLKVLGKSAKDIVISGDKVADAATMSSFVSAYDARHRIELDSDKAVIVVGNDDFPLPIPVAREGSVWRFDPARGRAEILARRIGRNELDAIQTCLAYVDAQREYAELDHASGGAGSFAQRIVSQPGKKDGLYWPTAPGEDQSPIGEFVAEATRQGYRVGGKRQPFHGYYFKVLTKQGSAAPGGELEYVVRGRMIGGFALVAYPASYRNSGVMTFIVNHAGIVYQKNLGPNTAAMAERMTSYNPDGSWQKAKLQ